jgi:plastocyanin
MRTDAVGISRRVWLGLCALPVCAALAGCGSGGPAHGRPAAGAAAVVDMGFTSFNPPEITVRVGDTVEWRNRSLITHTVTADPARAGKAGDSALPAAGQAFDSGDIAAGEIYMHRFTVPGTYRYFCAHHESMGMVASIVVRP